MKNVGVNWVNIMGLTILIYAYSKLFQGHFDCCRNKILLDYLFFSNEDSINCILE